MAGAALMWKGLVLLVVTVFKVEKKYYIMNYKLDFEKC